MPPTASEHGYRIDYDRVDVDDLVAQIRERIARSERAVEISPDAVADRTRGALRTYLDLDEQRPYELEKELRLEGEWNVRPEDLRRSGRRGIGLLIGTLRNLARPLLKLAVNLDLPLYKQFKINLGVAEALHDLLKENRELRSRTEQLAARLDALETEVGTDPTEDDRSGGAGEPPPGREATADPTT